MCKRVRFIVCLGLIVLSLNGQVASQQRTNETTTASELSDREKDGLIGPVRRVTVESSKIVVKNGSAPEAVRSLREVATYDPRGKKVDSVAYPFDGQSLPGKEHYKYDDKGNIVEMQLRSQDGRLLSKESYRYELDAVGNWKKMTTWLAVFENGKVRDEPVEVTYRTISYFYNQEIAKLVTPGPASARTTRSAPRNGVNGNQPVGRSKTGNPAMPQGQTSEVPSSVSSNKVSATEASTPSNEHAAGVNVSNTIAETPAGSPPVHPVPIASLDATSAFKLGLSYLESGKPAEAIPPLKEAVHKNPENTVAYVKLGLAYSALHRYDEAIAFFKMAIHIKRDLVNAEAYYQLGQAYTGTGKHSDALASFKHALSLTKSDANSIPGHKAQTMPTAEELHYSLGLTYHRLTKYTDAVKELQKVVGINPRLAEGYYSLAVCYLALGDRRSAEKQQKVLTTLNPDLAQKIAAALSSNRIMPPGIPQTMLGRRRLD